MTVLRRLLAGAALLLLLAAGWLWWTRPVPVDMAEYVPADALIYLEINDLPAVARVLASTEAMRAVPPERRRGLDWAGEPWLDNLISLTGLAPHRSVVLARAQASVAVLGFEAREVGEVGEDSSLRFTPRVAVVAETHTPEWRARSAVEQLVGGLARSTYGAPSVERKEVDGVGFVSWVSPAEPGRRLVAAVEGGVAVVGNDEAAVKACLEVRRGARQSLAGDARLGAMRQRLGRGQESALAFGYAPAGSAAKVVENLAPAFAGGAAGDPRVQGLLATLLPQMVGKVVGAIGWVAVAADGLIEDRYFVSLPGDVAQRLDVPFAVHPEWGEGGAALLPPDTHQFTQYNLRSPELAWRGFGAALSSQFDVTRGPVITLGLEALVRPYGVERPRDFLRAVGPSIVTARLAPESERRVLVVEAFDREALLAQARQFLGPGLKTEKTDGAELLISADEDRGAAAFVAGHLLLGAAADVRRCVEAARLNQSLRSAEAYRLFESSFATEGTALSRTLTDDGAAVAAVVALLSSKGEGNPGAAGDAAGRGTRARHSVSRTRLAEGGFEKKTRSAFGLFGELLGRAAQRR
ncbi:MAG TPA: hypothetical protein VEY09_11700 [Pyrinomonadaceae bacterium]|nr:hypothetical protein [Pyrinomonadaceae bacterium]